MNDQSHKALEIIKDITPENPIDLNFKGENGYTALILASRDGHTEVVALLLPKCSEETINIQNIFGNTALICASYNGHTEIVISLLTKCSESTINIKNKNGNTALIWASCDGHTEIVKELIYLSDIHIKNNQNKSSFDLSYSKKITDLFDLNTGCDTSLRYGKSISNVTLASLHSLKSYRWLNLF